MSRNKKVLFIGRQDDRLHYDTAASMAAQMSENGKGIIAYEACIFDDLTFLFDGKSISILSGINTVPLENYDGIFLLGWFNDPLNEDRALSMAQYAHAKGVPLLNDEVLYTRSRSKLSQYVIGALHDVKMAPFLIMGKGATGATKELLQKAGLTFPLIIKAVNAARGNDNYLVRTDDELQEVYQRSPELIFVVQQYVPNDGDYRLLVMGDKVRVAIHRQSSNESHLNNTSRGGEARLVDVDTLDADMLADSVKIARLLRRPVTGVDMIVHSQSGEYYFLEANNMPQLSTGTLVSEKMRALDDYFADWLAESDKN